MHLASLDIYWYQTLETFNIAIEWRPPYECNMDSRNIHLKGARWKNISRDVHGEVVLRQYSEHKAEEQEQYKELQEEPMLTSPL